MNTTTKFQSARGVLPGIDAPRLVPLALGMALFLVTLVAVAAEQDTDLASPNWLQLGLEMFGGLALLLAGLQL